MDTKSPELDPDQPEQGNESQSPLDPESLVQDLADRAEALIPKDADAASALELVAQVLRQDTDPANLSANLDRALTALEKQQAWSIDTRVLAFELTQLDQRERSEMPLSFDGAVDKLKSLGRSDIEMLLDFDAMDDYQQVDAIENLLEIVEDLMASFPQNEVDKSQLQEYRAIRNALLSHQEELNIAIQSAEADQYDAFKGEEEEDDAQAKVAAVYKKAQGSSEPDREELELDDQRLLAKIPEDPDGLMWYESGNFQVDQRTREQVPYLRAFVTRRLLQAAEEVPTAGYRGTVSDIMGDKGDALNFLRLVASTKLAGQMISRSVFSKMSFTQVADTIGLNVKLDDNGISVVPDTDKR